MSNIGLGDHNFEFAVYIRNKPNMFEYQHLTEVLPVTKDEINMINQACGNGWRKVFNVYAKLLYCLDCQYYEYATLAPSWQEYRDEYLLQVQSKTALLFSAPQLLSNSKENKQRKTKTNKNTVHIICGKGHAKELIERGELQDNLVWLDDEFALDRENKLIVCPYFDYRQLSNCKIERLAALLLAFKSPLMK